MKFERSLRIRDREDFPWHLSIARHPETSKRDWDFGPGTRRGQAIGRFSRPLLRFLRRQVGQRWADVEREIDARCRAIAVDRHIRAAVRRVVFSEVLGTRYSDFRWYRSYEFSIDPGNGLLCFQARPPRHARDDSKTAEELKISPVRI